MSDGRSPVVLQPHRGAQSTLAQALLDAREEILGPARRLEIGIARDANGVAREDVVARVDRRQMQVDRVLERYEDVPAVRIGQRDESRQGKARDVNHGQAGVREGRARSRADGGHQTEGPVPEIREGMGGVDGERRQDR